MRKQQVERLQRLRDISGNVALFLDEEMFKDVEGADNYTVEDILEDCYAIILSELKDMGVSLDGDQDYLQDGYTCDKLLSLRKLLDYDTFKEYLKIPTVLDAVETQTLSESASDELLDWLLDYFVNNFSDDILVMDTNYVTTIVVQNTNFLGHISGCVKRMRDGNLDTSRDATIQDIRAFINHLHEVRKRIKILVDFLLMKNTVDTSTIATYVDTYDLDKTSGDNLSKFATLYSVKLPKEVEDKLTLTHRRNNNHHLEYFTSRDLSPSDEELIMMVVHIYEEHDADDTLDSSYQDEIDQVHLELQKHFGRDVATKFVTLVNQMKEFTWNS